MAEGNQERAQAGGDKIGYRLSIAFRQVEMEKDILGMARVVRWLCLSHEP